MCIVLLEGSVTDGMQITGASRRYGTVNKLTGDLGLDGDWADRVLYALRRGFGSFITRNNTDIVTVWLGCVGTPRRCRYCCVC